MLSARCGRLFRALPLVLVVLVIFAAFVLPLASIQLRLSRNGALAARLVESLQTQFPGAEFRGGASYEREVVYIQVAGKLAPERRSDIEQWLRRLKAEQGIAPAIWLTFPEFTGEEKDAVIL